MPQCTVKDCTGIGQNSFKLANGEVALFCDACCIFCADPNCDELCDESRHCIVCNAGFCEVHLTEVRCTTCQLAPLSLNDEVTEIVRDNEVDVLEHVLSQIRDVAISHLQKTTALVLQTGDFVRNHEIRIINDEDGRTLTVRHTGTGTSLKEMQDLKRLLAEGKLPRCNGVGLETAFCVADTLSIIGNGERLVLSLDGELEVCHHASERDEMEIILRLRPAFRLSDSVVQKFCETSNDSHHPFRSFTVIINLRNHQGFVERTRGFEHLVSLEEESSRESHVHNRGSQGDCGC